MKYLIFTCALLVVAASAQAQQFRISGMQDANFGIWNSANQTAFDLIIENTTVCAWKQTGGSPQYRITMSDGTNNGVYQLSDGQGNTINFTMGYNRSSAAGYTDVPENVATGTFNQPNREAVTDCSVGGTSGKYRVVLPNQNMIGKPMGTYTATISITMGP